MMDLLVLRERMKIFYQKSQLIIDPLVKFIFSLLVFVIINENFGYNPRLKDMGIVLLISLLCAFTPLSILLLLAGGIMIAHVYAVSQILSIIVLSIFFIIYFLFARFTPKQGYVVLLIPILYMLRMPYLLPILLGIIAGPASIVSAGCGVAIYYLVKVVKDTAELTSSNTKDNPLELFQYVVDRLVNNKEMLYTLVIFSVVILITYFIRRMPFDHAFDLAIIAGAVTNILGFLIADLDMNVSNHIGFMIIGTIVAAMIVYIIQFFRLTLDYTGVERVQFEDDDYYYYVKAVPKMNVTTPKKDIKRISGTKDLRNEEEEVEENLFEDMEQDNLTD